MQVSESVGHAIPDHLLPQLKCFVSFGVDIPELSKIFRVQITSRDVKRKVIAPALLAYAIAVF